MPEHPVYRMTFTEMFLLNQNAPIGHPLLRVGSLEADAFTNRFQALAAVVTPDELRALADRMEDDDA